MKHLKELDQIFQKLHKAAELILDSQEMVLDLEDKHLDLEDKHLDLEDKQVDIELAKLDDLEKSGSSLSPHRKTIKNLHAKKE